MRTLTHFICAAGLALTLISCGESNAPPSGLVVGIVNLTPTVEETIRGFKDGLAEQGYTEGSVLRYAYEGPVKQMNKLDAAIETVVAQKPDLILSLLTPVTLRVKVATAENGIPVVFGPVGDPVGAGIVPSLKEPRGNLTGVRTFGWEGKALEWFSRIVTDLDTLFVPYNPQDPAMVIGLEALKRVAGDRKIALRVVEVRSEGELENAFRQLQPGIDGVWVLGSGFWGPFVDHYIQWANDRSLPIKGTTMDWCRRGALFSFSEDLYQLGKQQARMAASILSGVTPDQLPVEQADFYLTVNPDTAKAIGLTLPTPLLKQADFIVTANTAGSGKGNEADH